MRAEIANDAARGDVDERRPLLALFAFGRVIARDLRIARVCLDLAVVIERACRDYSHEDGFGVVTAVALRALGGRVHLKQTAKASKARDASEKMFLGIGPPIQWAHYTKAGD